MITQEYLKKILHYNPSSGKFTRLKSLGNKKKGSSVGWMANGEDVY